MVKSILLSAGESRRMGRLKPLLPLGDKTVIEVLLKEYLSSSLSEVILVLGYRAKDIRKVLDKKFYNDRLKIVINKNYGKEMFSSIQVGLNKVENTEGILIGLADQVLIDGGIIDKLVKNYHPGEILIPTFQGRKGHPIIIPYTLKKEIIMGNPDETTLRDVLSRHKEETEFIKMESDNILFDMDTKEAYEKVKSLWRK